MLLKLKGIFKPLFVFVVDVQYSMQIVAGWSGFVELPGLTTDDHVTLMIIEHYLDLKVSCC